MRGIGPFLVLGGWWGDAVLEHGGAAKEVFLTALEAVAEEGEPAWGWGVGDAEGKESITTGSEN